MGYRVIFNFADGTSDDITEEIYDTYEDAEEAALETASNYSAGGDVLELSGEEAGAKIEDWDIEEV